MKYFKSILVLFSLIQLTLNQVNAQIDTVFWFAAPWVTPDHDNNVQMAWRISTFNNPTTVRIQQPASAYDTTFTIAPNTVFSKSMTHLVNQLESKPANAILNTGFKITSNELTTVVYDFISDTLVISPGTPNNPETYSLKGTNGLGTEFVTPFQTRWRNRTLTGDVNGDGIITQPKQYFSVVATQNNTTIWITPRCPVIGGHPANVTYSVFLPFAGSVYTCENTTQITNVVGSNLSGSIVVSDKPIAITTNDDSVNPSGGGGCFDLMGDQIVPTDVIGNEYIVNRGFLNAGSEESIYIVASENFTSVTIDDGTVTNFLMNQGETRRYNITQALTFISADKPIYLIHMSGYGCELGQAILPPLNCAGSDQVSFARNNAQQFLLNILCQAGDEGNFQLNGNPLLVPAASFNPVPGTGGAWVGTQIDFNTTDVPVNSANIITNSTGLFSLGVINGGPATGCLYHYMSSFLRRVYTNAGNDTILCNGEAFINLNGSVEGGSTTGVWTVLNGSGVLNNPTTLVTNYIPSTSDYAQGELTFVLSSTGNCTPVRDTMKVSFIQSPIVSTSFANSYCKNNITSVPVSGSFLYAAGSIWTGGAGGVFDNAGSPNTNYTPSPTDLNNDSVVLFYSSQGSFFACPNDQDTVVIYFVDPPSVFPGPDQVICATTPSFPVSGSIVGGNGTGVWSTNGSGAFDVSEFDLNTNYLVTSSDVSLGSFMLYLTTTNNGGCLPVTDSIEITVVDSPTIEITSSDSICSNINIANLSGTVTAGFPTVWTLTGIGTIVSPSSLNTFYNIHPLDTALGFIDVFFSTTGGICPVEQDSMRLFFVSPPTAIAGPNLTFCNNEVIGLNGIVTGPNSSGIWTSNGTGTFNPSANLLSTFYYPSPLDVANGSVNLTLSTLGEFGCAVESDVMTVVFKASPIANFSFSNACQGDNTAFTDLSTTTDGVINSWSWNFGNSQTSIANDPLHPYAASGNYNVTLIAGSSNGCYDTIQQNITVNPSPIAQFAPSVGCVDAPVQFIDGSFISSGSIVAWEYVFGDGNPNSFIQNPTHIFSPAGIYNVTLTATSNLGCNGSITIPLAIQNGPDASFGINPNPAFALENVFFTDESTSNVNLVSWFWEFGDESGDNAQNPTHNYADGGEYVIIMTVTDANGCSDTAVRNLTVALLPVLPTAFTPNGDGENDVFLIRGGPFKGVDFRVYNHWGELIFQTLDPNEGWDGTFKANNSPLGVYTWTFEVELADGRLIRRSGDVTLIR
jgi:gliding motility-associated-like protein